MTELFDKYGIRKKIIVFVKDEGSNLNAMIVALKVVINFESGLEENFLGTCFGHAFSKACQYNTTKEKVSKDLKCVFVKSTQANLQKCITWPKKSRKGMQGWNKACVKTSIHPKKLNILVKIK